MNLWRAIIKNWHLKLFSLGMAVVLFFFVSIERATPVDVDFRLEYHIPDNMLITNDVPMVLHTTLQGPWAALRNFDVNDLEPVEIDLEHASPGSMRIVIATDLVHPPGGMRIMAIRPASIELSIERRVERQVAVRADIPATPALGYEIRSVQVIPPKVRVVGPTSDLEAIEEITTRPLDVSGRDEDLSIEVDLRPPLSPLKLLDKRVSVYVEIGEEFVQRVFQNIPVRVENAPKGTIVTPSEISLTIRGPRLTIEKLDLMALDAWVDALPEAEGAESFFSKTVQLKTDLPKGAQIVAPVPRVDLQIPALDKKRRRE